MNKTREALELPEPGDLVRFKGFELMVEEVGEETTVLTDGLSLTVLVDTAAFNQEEKKA